MESPNCLKEVNSFIGLFEIFFHVCKCRRYRRVQLIPNNNVCNFIVVLGNKVWKIGQLLTAVKKLCKSDSYYAQFLVRMACCGYVTEQIITFLLNINLQSIECNNAISQRK